MEKVEKWILILFLSPHKSPFSYPFYFLLLFLRVFNEPTWAEYFNLLKLVYPLSIYLYLLGFVFQFVSIMKTDDNP